MLVGVCCECQQGGKLLRYERGRAIIDSHDAFGSFCKGSGTAPQATYDDSRIEKDPAYALEKLAGVKVCVIEGKGASVSECDGETCAECNSGPIFSLEDHAASCSKSTFKSDRLIFEEEDHIPDSHSWIDAIPTERTSEHNSRSSDIYPDDQDRKNPGVFGTIGDLILAAKNDKQKTKRG